MAEIKNIDKEIEALKTIIKVLQPLTPLQKNRVMVEVLDHLMKEKP